MSELLSPREVSMLLRVSASTLYQWQRRGYGPRAIRVGRGLRYSRDEIERWLQEEAKSLTGATG